MIHKTRIRQLLREHPTGVDKRAMAEELGIPYYNVTQILKRMPDVAMIKPPTEAVYAIKPGSEIRETTQEIVMRLMTGSDGMTIDDVSAATGVKYSAARAAMRSIGAYIDRWEATGEWTGRWRSVWCLPPAGEKYEDCPKPNQGRWR